MLRRIVPLFLGVLAVAPPGHLAAQALLAAIPSQQQPSRVPGAFRRRVTLVPVDVRVTDRDGRPVTDLTQQDFTILENGATQEIRHFSLETLASEPAGATAGPMLRKVPALELSPQDHRIFLIVLGRGRLQGPSKAVDVLIRFVRERLMPQDQVAVLAWNRATDFTTDHGRIAQVLERVKAKHELIEEQMKLRFSGLAAIYGSREIPKAMQAEIDEVFRAPGAIASRQVPPGSVTDAGRVNEDSRRATDVMQRADAGLPVSPLEQLDADKVTDLPFDEYVSTSTQTNQDLVRIYTGIEYLRYLEGEKHLVFVTEQGLFLPRLENDKSLAAMANDARVAIDTIQTGGVYAEDVAGRTSLSRNQALTSLRTVSEFTGGQSSVHNEPKAALERIDQVTRAGYLLGYYPSDSNWNGAYRRITVKVNRPNVVVSFRHGYYARQALVPFDRKAFLSYSRIVAAGNYPEDVHDIKVKTSTSEVTGKDGSREVEIALAIDPSRIRFESVEDRHVASIDISMFYADAKGRVIGELWQTMDMRLSEHNYQAIQQVGISFRARIPASAGAKLVKVVVYNYDADVVGSAVAKIR